MFCQMLAGGLPFSISLPFDQCTVPQGINGPVAIFITSDSQPLVANVVQQATSQLVAGPTMAFIDTQTDVLGQMIRTVSSGGATSSNASTTTISPGAATSIISSASAASASPTATGAYAAAVAGLSGTNTTATPPPNLATGASPDGNVDING
jgi:hypothetical protein